MKFCLKCFSSNVQNDVCANCGSNKTHEWVIHYVNNKICTECEGDQDDDTALKANIHTHGLLENYNHLEIQICLPIHPELAFSILNEVAYKVKGGKVFCENTRYSEVLQNLDVLMVKAKDEGVDILRLIIPDKDGNLDKEKLTGDYQMQYKGILSIV